MATCFCGNGRRHSYPLCGRRSERRPAHRDGAWVAGPVVRVARAFSLDEANFMHRFNALTDASSLPFLQHQIQALKATYRLIVPGIIQYFRKGTINYNDPNNATGYQMSVDSDKVRNRQVLPPTEPKTFPGTW